MGAINSIDKIAATLSSLGTWLVSGIYVYISCIKEIVSLPIIIIIIIIIEIPKLCMSHASPLKTERERERENGVLLFV
jgi:hypothetical protein